MNIIITGASKGIGKAIAEKFAAQGYDLFLCSRQEEALKELSETLQHKFPGITVNFKTCDVAEEKEVAGFAEWVLSKTASPDIIINNAGTFTQGSIHEEQDGALEQLMKTNVYSAYYLSRKLLPAMIKRKSGHIFNICSIASLKAYKYGGSYSITKYAMAGLSANLRDELMKEGIKVTSVFPGAVYTASWAGSGVEPGRIMKADDIAEMIFTAATLSAQACVEEIVIRPQLGDL